jgi:hypothetical protein
LEKKLKYLINDIRSIKKKKIRVTNKGTMSILKKCSKNKFFVFEAKFILVLSKSKFR